MRAPIGGARRALLWSIVALVSSVGCDLVSFDRRVRVEVTRDAGGYVFWFTGCANWFRKEQVQVFDVSVLKGIGPIDGLSKQCELHHSDPYAPSFRGTWRYGEKVAGYDMSPCQPLVPGENYQVHVVGAAGGQRVFSLKANGDVDQSDGSCR